MGASKYRDFYNKASKEFPGEYGEVPPELLEAIVNLESGGEPNAQTGTATGLGQIMPTGLEYNAALMNPAFVAKYGNAPDLYDPATNIAVMTIGLTARHDAGIASKLDGGYGAWGDWFATSLGYFGAVGNESDPATNAPYTATYTPDDSALDNNDGNYNGRKYLNVLGEYIAFGSGANSWNAYTNIDKLGPGSFNPVTGEYNHDALYTEAKEIGGVSAWEWVSDTGKKWAVKGANVSGNVADYARDAYSYLKQIDDAIKAAIDFAPRAGFIVMGALLLIGSAALWSI